MRFSQLRSPLVNLSTSIALLVIVWCSCFFLNDTATPVIYTLSLHDALPIYCTWGCRADPRHSVNRGGSGLQNARSEEHTSELQSRQYLVCRLLLEKKKAILERLLALNHARAGVAAALQ